MLCYHHRSLTNLYQAHSLVHHLLTQDLLLSMLRHYLFLSEFVRPFYAPPPLRVIVEVFLTVTASPPSMFNPPPLDKTNAVVAI